MKSVNLNYAESSLISTKRSEETKYLLLNTLDPKCVADPVCSQSAPVCMSRHHGEIMSVLVAQCYVSKGKREYINQSKSVQSFLMDSNLNIHTSHDYCQKQWDLLSKYHEYPLCININTSTQTYKDMFLLSYEYNLYPFSSE